MPDKRVALIGFDLEIQELVEHCGFEYIGYFDLVRQGPGYLGADEDAKEQTFLKVLAMQRPSTRQRLFEFYREHLATLRHPTAYISPSAEVSSGAVIQRGCTVLPRAIIGVGCQINIGASVHHESVIGDFTTIAPHAVILGRCTIGKAAYIGAGAIIKERCVVGQEAIVGAGAVVVKDVPPRTTVVGNPARPINDRPVFAG